MIIDPFLASSLGWNDTEPLPSWPRQMVLVVIVDWTGKRAICPSLMATQAATVAWDRKQAQSLDAPSRLFGGAPRKRRRVFFIACQGFA